MNSSSETFSRSRSETVVCTVTPYWPALSETFIRGHIERLRAKVVLVHSWPPSVGNRPVLSLPTRLAYKIRKRLARNGSVNETTAAYIKAFQRSHTDVVLAEYGTIGALVMDACRRLNLPLVVHFHGYDASVHDVLAEYATSYPKMFHQAAAIIAVSRAMERKLISLGAPPEKVHYNPYGINCREFGGANPGIAPPVFLAVGRFVEKKAPQVTLRAFAEAWRQFPEVQLRMIGDGPLLDECRQLAASLKIESAVTFLGPQPHSVVQQEMRAARCFVQHSLEASNGDCEGTPVGILEAGASGLPVVSTRHAGIPDVVVEEQTGFLVDEGDANGMASHMLRIAQEPELAAQLWQRARQRVESKFSEERSLGRLSSIIEACLTNRSDEPEESSVIGRRSLIQN